MAYRIKEHRIPPLELSQNSIDGLGFLWLEITQKCNLTCAHCYVESSPRLPLLSELSLGDWLRVLSESADVGCKSVQFIGGEPTLHPHLDQLIEYAAGNGFDFIEVFTNATTLSLNRIDTFLRYKVNVACSFYSACGETHDQITGKKGSFDKTVEAIRKAVTSGLSLRVGIIEMDANKQNKKETIDFLRTLGVNKIGGDRVRSIGRGSNIRTNKEHKFGDLCGQCWRQKLCVTYNGQVYPCIMSRNHNVGNVRKQSLNAILCSNELKAFRTNMKEHTERIRCWSGPCEPDICGPDCDPASCEPCEPNDCNPGCYPGPGPCLRADKLYTPSFYSHN